MTSWEYEVWFWRNRTYIQSQCHDEVNISPRWNDFSGRRLFFHGINANILSLYCWEPKVQCTRRRTASRLAVAFNLYEPVIKLFSLLLSNLSSFRWFWFRFFSLGWPPLANFSGVFSSILFGDSDLVTVLLMLVPWLPNILWIFIVSKLTNILSVE